jgi:LEA14-like dessication related protein
MKTRSGSLVLAALVASALLTPACAVKAPILALDGVKVGDMGVTGVALDVRFRVRNPNPEPLRVDRMEYELFINGNRVGRGFDVNALPLEGFGEGKVASRVDVNFLGLPGAIKDVLHEDKVEARVKGHFYTSGHYGNKRLGFDSEAEVNLRDRR